MTTPTTILVCAPQPMAPEQAEAYLTRIEHLLADLEAACSGLENASWGENGDHTTARYLPDETIRPLSQWLDRCDAILCNTCEQSDLHGWDS